MADGSTINVAKLVASFSGEVRCHGGVPMRARRVLSAAAHLAAAAAVAAGSATRGATSLLLGERGADESGQVTIDVADVGRVGDEDPTSQRGLNGAQDVERVAPERIDEPRASCKKGAETGAGRPFATGTAGIGALKDGAIAGCHPQVDVAEHRGAASLNRSTALCEE
jgi:hypothetical protein